MHNFDIICIVESKLKNDNVIQLNGYKWFGHNRCNIHNNDNGSGGTGVFVKNYLFFIYDLPDRFYLVLKHWDMLAQIEMKNERNAFLSCLLNS